jgi:acylphosphatase
MECWAQSPGNSRPDREPPMDNRHQAGIAQTLARYHLWVRGRVQGVGFRFFALQQAQRWGVAGWTRNLPDGRVEIIAEGDSRALDEFVSGVRRGPEGAQVQEVRVEREAPTQMHGFQIR